jgi:hypothetical protein
LDQPESRQPRSRAAIERLERSLRRLEEVMANRAGDLFLAEELRVARDAYSRLDNAAQAVEGRLNAVVDRLKSVLEG